MNDQDRRDCFAMFALAGLLMRGDNWSACPERAYEIADRMLQVSKEEPEVGIKTVKKPRKING